MGIAIWRERRCVGLWRYRGDLVISAALRRALFGVGPTAACRAALQRMRYRPAACDTEPDAFDRARGSETTGFSSWRALRTGRACDPYNAGYLPAEPAAAETLLSCVTQPEAFTFVDLGCGKGRVLTLAAEKGFRRVIGIEVHPALAAIARENVARSHPDIEIWNEDAVEVTLPSEKLVLFLFTHSGGR